MFGLTLSNNDKRIWAVDYEGVIQHPDQTLVGWNQDKSIASPLPTA